MKKTLTAVFLLTASFLSGRGAIAPCKKLCKTGIETSFGLIVSIH